MSLLSKIVNLFSHTSQNTGVGSSDKAGVTSKVMRDTAREAATEGIVLLKNDGTLPFSATDEVAVFGRVQYDWFCVGYGSGGDVRAPYKVSFANALNNQKDFKINRELSDLYEKWCKAHVPDEGFWGHWPYSFKEMLLSAEIVKNARKTSNIAIVTIGRSAGEDREQKLAEGSFGLTKAEFHMLNMVTRYFEKTVVVLDVGNVIDFTEINYFGDKISAIVLAWQGGMESGHALCDVLSGRVNPSGRLTDTIARDYAFYPSAFNFGAKKFNVYEEDVFVGYRYFETFAQASVLYPFGFGLSYTNFDVSCSAEKNESGVTVHATVKNIGQRKGKTVVQVYVKKADGELLKPARELVAYAKTKELDVGEELSLSFDISEYELSCYDDEGKTGFKACWVLEYGDYEFYVGENVRDAKRIASISFDKKVTSECHSVCRPQHKLRLLESFCYNADTLDWEFRFTPSESGYLKDRILAELPDEIAPNRHLNVSFDDVKSGVATLEEFVSTLSDEELELLCHGDYKMNSPLGSPGNAGVFGGISESLRAKGVPCATTTDGPSGLRLHCKASLLPCGTAIASSWNRELAQRLYACLGDEMVEKGSDILLGPGMNIHRDMLCGRNFEYYSEDPYLSGTMACAVVNGIQSKGVGSCVKHFACNNQERARYINDSRLSERALREIYLKGFEIVVKNAKPLALMMSYNKINGVYAYHNYDLATTVLRKEWGYNGVVFTDWWTKKGKNPDFKGVDDNAYRVRAQVDLLMPGGSRVLGRYDGSTLKSLKRNGLTRAELQRSAKNVLSALLRLSSNKEKSDKDFD